MWKFGESKAQTEKIWQPKVVGGHPCICLCLYLLLVHKAPRGLPLQVLVNIRRPVDPAVLVCVRSELLPCLAEDRLHVQVVLHEDEDEPHHDDERGHLVVEFEEGPIDFCLVASKPLHHLGDDWQLVDYRVWGHLGKCTAVLLFTWPSFSEDNTVILVR